MVAIGCGSFGFGGSIDDAPGDRARGGAVCDGRGRGGLRRRGCDQASRLQLLQGGLSRMRKEARNFRAQVSRSKHCLAPILFLLVDGRPRRKLQGVVGMVWQRRGRSYASREFWLACVQRADKRLAVAEWQVALEMPGKRVDLSEEGKQGQGSMR